jgi:hypothetical protein
VASELKIIACLSELKRQPTSGNSCGNSPRLVQMRTRVMNQLHVVALNEGLRRKKALLAARAGPCAAGVVGARPVGQLTTRRNEIHVKVEMPPWLLGFVAGGILFTLKIMVATDRAEPPPTSLSELDSTRHLPFWSIHLTCQKWSQFCDNSVAAADVRLRIGHGWVQSIPIARLSYRCLQRSTNGSSPALHKPP